MKTLFAFSNVLTILGLLSLVIFGFRWNSGDSPSSFEKNLKYMSYACIAVGYFLTVFYYLKTKNPKKAKQLLLVAAIIAVTVFALYYITK